MIERSHLKILREIDCQGSLTAAARALHLTQSALSHKITRLEQLLGTPLWQKEGRGLKLTQAGDYLLQQANRLLPQLAMLCRGRPDHVRGQHMVLSKGMFPGML